MDTPADHPKVSTFSVGETIYPRNLEASFRVLSVGNGGICVTRTSAKAIVPMAPFLVTFKNVLFKVIGWNGREFSLRAIREEDAP